jgi:hypothetical protein
LLEIIEALDENPNDSMLIECDDERTVRQTVPAFCVVRGYRCEVESSWGSVYRLRLEPMPVPA